MLHTFYNKSFVLKKHDIFTKKSHGKNHLQEPMIIKY